MAKHAVVAHAGELVSFEIGVRGQIGPHFLAAHHHVLQVVKGLHLARPQQRPRRKGEVG